MIINTMKTANSTEFKTKMKRKRSANPLVSLRNANAMEKVKKSARTTRLPTDEYIFNALVYFFSSPTR